MLKTYQVAGSYDSGSFGRTRDSAAGLVRSPLPTAAQRLVQSDQVGSQVLSALGQRVFV